MQLSVQRTFQRPAMWQMTVEAGDLDSSGYAEISSSPNAFIGSNTDNTPLAGTAYNLDITVDGVLRQLAAIDMSGKANWDAVATEIQADLRALTASTETVEITGGKIKVTSATNGPTSTVVIAEGTGAGVSGGLLAAINTLTDYTVTLETPVNGAEGAVYLVVDANASSSNPTDSLIYMIDVKDSNNIHKSGLKSSYSETTGLLTIEDDADVTEIAIGDVITVLGHFHR